MSERNETVARLMAADAPAARDLTFEMEVLARIEQRRFAGTVVRNLGLAVVAVLVLASLAPWIEPLPGLMADWTQAPTDTLIMAILILSAALALWQAKLARDG
jgi:hypothetical protein